MAIFWRDKDGNESITHEGLVLSVEKTVDRVMSDVYADATYAHVWNPETEEIDRVLIGLAFECYQGPWGHAEEDAADAIHEHLARKKAERRAAIVAAAREREAARPAKGKILRVIKGRKTPIGTTGECIWEGPDKYRAHGRRVGIKDHRGEVHWTSSNNVEVVRESPEDEARARYEDERYANRYDSPAAFTLREEPRPAAPEPQEPMGPPPGTWAATARMMAASDPDYDWDAWKDEMKEGMLW